jgi:hypothetical protein
LVGQAEKEKEMMMMLMMNSEIESGLHEGMTRIEINLDSGTVFEHVRGLCTREGRMEVGAARRSSDLV